LWMTGYTGFLAKNINGISFFPTPLLEAVGEWLLLFLILIWRRKNIQYAGQVWVWFVGGYALMRFIAEFFRDPDVQIWYLYWDWMTLGHIFSIIMLLSSILLSFLLKNKKKV
jgi:phosphatidylglycerol:prolipoprotein diacylglycerol transferase